MGGRDEEELGGNEKKASHTREREREDKKTTTTYVQRQTTTTADLLLSPTTSGLLGKLSPLLLLSSAWPIRIPTVVISPVHGLDEAIGSFVIHFDEEEEERGEREAQTNRQKNLPGLCVCARASKIQCI